MLAGEDGVKVDTMVRWFVSEAVGFRGMVADARARAAIRSAAEAIRSAAEALGQAVDSSRVRSGRESYLARQISST